MMDDECIMMNIEQGMSNIEVLACRIWTFVVLLMSKVYQTELNLNSNFFQKLIIQTQFCLANSLSP